MQRPSDAQVEVDRHRLTSRNPLAMLIRSFLDDPSSDSLEIIAPEPGTVLDDGATFLGTPDTTPEKLYSRLYTIAVRGHWSKRDVWVQKKGRSTWLYKYDPRASR